MVKHMKQILHTLGWNMLKHVEPCWTPINNGLVGTDRLVQDFATIHSTCPVMENQTYGIRWQSDNPNFFHEEVVILELQAATFSMTSGLQVCFDVEAAQEDGVRSAEASVSWMASRWCYGLNQHGEQFIRTDEDWGNWFGFKGKSKPETMVFTSKI